MWSLSLIKKCKKVSRILRWQPPPPTWSSGAARKYQPFKKISILCGWVGSVVNVDIVSKFRDIWQSGWVCPASNVDIVSKTSGKVANHSETGLSYWESNFHQEAGMENKTEDVQARKGWANKIKLKDRMFMGYLIKSKWKFKVKIKVKNKMAIYMGTLWNKLYLGMGSFKLF